MSGERSVLLVPSIRSRRQPSTASKNCQHVKCSNAQDQMRRSMRAIASSCMNDSQSVDNGLRELISSTHPAPSQGEYGQFQYLPASMVYASHTSSIFPTRGQLVLVSRNITVYSCSEFRDTPQHVNQVSETATSGGLMY